MPSIRAGPVGENSEDAPPAPTGSAIDAEARRWLDEPIARRQELTELIIDYCARRPVACVDRFAATAEPETLHLAAPYTNDGLHLTTEGYRLLAHLLYKQVFVNSFEC